jgi:hypothetical protein
VLSSARAIIICGVRQSGVHVFIPCLITFCYDSNVGHVRLVLWTLRKTSLLSAERGRDGTNGIRRVDNGACQCHRTELVLCRRQDSRSPF